MGLRKILQGFIALLLIAAVAAGVLFSFRYHPLIRRTIGPDGICGPFDEVFTYEDWFQVTGDGESCFYAAEYGGKYYIVTLETLYGPFDVIVPFRAPAQSNSWGFAAQTKNTIIVVVNGETRYVIRNAGSIYYGGYSSCMCHDVISENENTTLSADGSRWALKVKRDDGEYAFVNGEELGPFERIFYVKISPEGSNWGAAITLGGYQYAVVNGRKYGPFEPAGDLEAKYPLTHTEIGFSRKGDTCAVFGGRHTEKEQLFVNAEAYGPHRVIDRFRWSDSGNSWCFTAIKDGQAYLILNGLIWGAYETYDYNRPFEAWPWGNVSDDGSLWGLSFTLKDKKHVTINGTTYGPYDYASSPVFSDDNTTWGFAARRNGSAYVIIDGEEKGPYEEALPLFLEGTSYAYWMRRNGSWYVVVNGAEWGPYSNEILPETSESYIKLSGSNWAFCDETEEGVNVVINGEAFGPYDSAFWYENLEFSDHGLSWAYRVLKGERAYAVLNGVEYGPFGRDRWGYHSIKLFSTADNAGFWAIEELPDKMYRLVKKTATGEGVNDE
jgi:hypothetical protein